MKKFFVLTVGFSALFEVSVRAQSFKAMSYNVQNLFDTVNNPDTNDEEFLPNGAQKWTEQIVADKIQNLGTVIRAENPDILGVTELENQVMLDRLNKEGLAGQGYVTAIAGPSDDARGIRTGILSKFPLIETQSHRVYKDTWRDQHGAPQKTRDILEVTLNAKSAIRRLDNLVTDADNSNGASSDAEDAHRSYVTVLMNHWPSRAGGPERNKMRLEVAQQMAEITKQILLKNPSRLVIAMGDFNDELNDASMSQGLNLLNSVGELASASVGSFFPADNDIAGLPVDQRGTFYFASGKQWNALDHILVSEGSDLAAGKSGGFHYRSNSFKIVRSTKFMTNGVYPRGCETHGSDQAGRVGLRCPNGASDHLPISAVFDVR